MKLGQFGNDTSMGITATDNNMAMLEQANCMMIEINVQHHGNG